MSKTNNVGSHLPRTLTTLLALVFSLLMLNPVWASNGTTLTAQVDRSTIEMGETVNLRVRFEGAQTREEPAFNTLSTQFDVLSNQKSVQTTMINNEVRMYTEWSLSLAPKSAGKVLIPPFTVQGQSSDPITLTVNEASRDPVSGKQDVFLETVVNKTEGYVQEQFLVSYRLYFNRRVDQLDMGDFNVATARVEELSRVDYQRTIGHTQYGVAEFRYAIFPDSSGTLHIPQADWTVRTVDQPAMGRFRNTGQFRLHRVSTDPIELEVAPRPQEYPAGRAWLPARDVQLEDNWSHSPEQLKVGEPVTRHITVRAQGVSPEQLPPIFTDTNPAGFRFYPDQPSQNKYSDADGITGVRTESVAIVPSGSGELTLPPVEVTWWDTREQTVRTASLPAQTVTVQAGEGRGTSDLAGSGPDAPSLAQPPAHTDSSTAQPGDPVTSSGTLFWPISSGFMALLCLLFAGLWWRERTAAQSSDQPRKSPTQQGNRQALREALKLCREGSPRALRQALLHWAALQWPEQANPTLASITARSSNPEFSEALHRLDAQLYAQHSVEMDRVEVDGAAIARGLEQLTAQSNSAPSGEVGALRPLYVNQ